MLIEIVAIGGFVFYYIYDLNIPEYTLKIRDQGAVCQTYVSVGSRK
jgi:hypothetical protein